MTCDMWRVTLDTWHMTHDMLGGALTVCDLWYYENMVEKAGLLTDWITDKAVYRTSPASPGLLNIGIPL